MYISNQHFSQHDTLSFKRLKKLDRRKCSGFFLLEVQSVWKETVEKSIELPLRLWNVLESLKLRFIEEALTRAPFTQADQLRWYKEHEILEATQDRIRS